jgi:hypothetical protein
MLFRKLLYISLSFATDITIRLSEFYSLFFAFTHHKVDELKINRTA